MLEQLATARIGLARIEKGRGHTALACERYREAASLYQELTGRGILRPFQESDASEARREASRCGS
jgi:hypothetical protein